MTQPMYPPAECGPACTEQHTYRLDECALCTANLHGGYASPSWTVACPRCHTPADRPCLRRDGTASSVDCQERWTAYNAAQQQPKPAQPTDRPDINQLTSDQLDQLYDERDAAHADCDGWRERAQGYRLATERVRALHSRWEYDANSCSVCVDCYGTPLSYPCPTLAVLDQHGQTTA